MSTLFQSHRYTIAFYKWLYVIRKLTETYDKQVKSYNSWLEWTYGRKADDYLAGRIISYALYIHTMAEDIVFKYQLFNRNWDQTIISNTRINHIKQLSEPRTTCHGGDRFTGTVKREVLVATPHNYLFQGLDSIRRDFLLARSIPMDE